ncbi:phage tail tape measure protein [Methylobacterium sp. E-016]|uniref:phage tail tape measure protein n=1 Tax=Methylobacterium sp. E-016 TaxID=2836556 RepID=UPI001FBBA133|nr:phage tail tape measure protein [Methylobacterium sp. E-016]MCJ2077887.1 phage tail tape measure protein [Methylobacterium sp. E-016]
MAKTLEACLVITGEDRASQIIDKITTATKRFARDADMSAAMRKNAEAAAKTEQAFNAVAKAMAGREGFAKAQSDLKAAEAGLRQYTKELDAARVAKTAFGNVKPAAGTDEAARYAAAAKGLREATVAQQRAEREVVKLTSAVGAQATAMKQADSAAAHLGADLSNLSAHQQKLRSTFEATTSAIAKQAAAEERASKVAAARQARVDAVRGAAGIIGIGAVHKAEHFAGHALHTYQHFDNERRFGKVVMDLTDEQQKPLVDQAIHMGAISRYNDVKVLHAQRELAARGLNRDQVLGMIPHVKDLGQALDIDIGAAAKQVEAGIFAFKKDISTLDAATKSAQQTADVQVKAAKISGMTPEDIQQAYKYGATPARLAHVSEERMLAFAGVLKKATIGGDEAGVAFRALMSMSNAPTAGAKVAMRAAGLDYNNYQKKPEKLAVDPFVKQVAESYGVKLDGTVQAGLRKIFSNKAIIGDSTKFTPAVMELLGDNLGGDDAKSKKSIAGLANRYRNASMQGVDSNRLIDDLLLKLRDNLAFANALFGSKQGGRIATALSDPETFKKMQHLLGAEHSAGYAAKVSEARMAGFDGAVLRFQGAVTNLETKLGRAWDNDGKGGALTDITSKAGQFIQHVAELDNRVVQAGTVAAGIGTVLVGLKSIGLLQSGFGMKPAAAELMTAAKMLQGAAVKNGGGLGGPSDSGGGKGGKLKGALKAGVAVAGAFGLEPLAELAQEHHIFEMPDVARDGWLRSGLDFLDPRFGNAFLGDRSKAIPSMAIKPGDAPYTLNGSGLSGFGLNGPINPEAPKPALPPRAHPKMIDAEATAREATEAGQKAGEAFGKAIVNAPLPPPSADTWDPLKTAAGEAGTQAGDRAGRGIAEGVQTQAPAVEQQGRSIMQRLQELFSAGIFVPIHLKGGEGLGGEGGGAGGGGGGSGPGGLIHRASFGGGGEGGTFGGRALPVGEGAGIGHTASKAERAAYTRQAAIARGMDPDVALRVTQSEGFNNYVGDQGRSFGDWQLFTGGGVGNRALAAGINVRDPSTWKKQTDFALDVAKKEGWSQWHGARRVGIGDWQGINARRRPSVPEMPTVPDAPPESAGAGGRGIDKHVDAFGQHVDRLAGMGFHGQIDLSVSGGGGQVRATSLRVKGRGAMTADMGITMPDLKDSDWA